MTRLHLGTLALLLLTSTANAGDNFLLKDARRVVFLGDSNTFAGHYITYLDGYLATRFPDKQYELINLGLPSETVSGLSEADHPYPRPDVHTRAERALAKTKPDVVVICYGMNDGIYSPFDEKRFERYQAGIHSLLDKVAKVGAKPVLMTPAPFDPNPVRKNLLPGTAAKFSWMKPYEDYDDTLRRYSAWLVTLRDKGIPVADPHTAIHEFLAFRRKDDPKYTLSGDGIHPSPTGHALVALELLKALNAPPSFDELQVDAAQRKIISGRGDVAIIKGDVWVQWTTRLPMLDDHRWDPKFVAFSRYSERWSRQVLKVTGLTAGDYELRAGDMSYAKFSSDELKRGVNLVTIESFYTNQRVRKIGQNIATRTQLLGLAWLDDVGHKRPDTPKGLPLAIAMKQAEPITASIRQRSQPIAVTLELRPIPSK